MPNVKPHAGRAHDLSAHQRAIGMVAIALICVTVAVTVIFYLRPPGQQVVAFSTTDAIALRTGEDVRVAGVPVGTVDRIILRADSVEVVTKIDNSIIIGDRTTVDVRMLTAVGGYYVTIAPSGDEPLNDAVIPEERVSVPYSIADVLQQAPRVTDEVDGEALDANIRQVARGLTDHTQSVGSVIDGLDSIAAIMNRQREQVTTTLDLAQSYVQTFNSNREYVFELIKKIELVLARYNATWQGFNETYALLGEILERISPVSWYYYDNRDRIKAAVTALRTGFANMQVQMEPVISQLTAILNSLKGIADSGGIEQISQNVILASDVCVPIPGRQC